MAEAKQTTKKTATKAAKKVKKPTVKTDDSVTIDQGGSNGNNQESNRSETQADEQGQDSLQTITTAKAGKRSSKSIKEAEAKEAKASRKAEQADGQASDDNPKKVQPKTRSRLERRSKGYRKASDLIDRSKVYELKDGLNTVIKTNPVKFDASVELHINLNVDPRQADQNIRGTVVLPAGSGKSVRIAVFADEADAKKAKTVGADIAAGDEFLKQLDKGTLDFNVLISTPANMAKLGKYARLLGPKGLMPNPKSGTVTQDVVKAVQEAKAGRVEYRVDSTGIIHVAIGKISFGSDKLEQNSQAIISSIKAAKPGSIKGIYVKSAYLTTTMGPSIKITI